MRSPRVRRAHSFACSRRTPDSFRCARTVGTKWSRDSLQWRRWHVSYRISSRRSFAARGARRGFTLIELLVTIAIIATLAAIVAPSLFGNIGDARHNTAKDQVQILSLALDAYRLDNEAFPTSEQGLEALRTIPVSGDAPANWKGPYLRQLVPIDPWGRPYVY